MLARSGRRTLVLAFCISLLVHLMGFGAQEWEHAEDAPDVHGAPRLIANLLATKAVVKPSVPPEQPKIRHKLRQPAPSSPPRKGATIARLPDSESQSAPEPAQSAAPDREVVRQQPEPADSQSQPESPVVATQSAPSAEAAGSEPLAQASVPVASVSAPAQQEAVIQLPVAQKLPERGEVLYLGTAGGFLALTATGRASWQHDGAHFESTLSAGLTSPDSSLDYRSSGSLAGLQMISESTRDNRRGKISTSVINQGTGKVFMQRGSDRRERDIRGFAVALSALPEMLMTLDEHIDKAAFFVVGDFWVDDAIVVQRAKDYLRLPVGRVQARHFSTRTKKGDLIDVWLAPQWRDAPVRIRIEASGIVVDLQATEIRIDGETLVSTPENP